MWLLGTVALFTGYLFQAAALDRGRLSVIQPLLVTTVVFALPLGYLLTKQHVGSREVIGAVVIIFGLGLFVYFGDPAGGKENASNLQWALTIGLLFTALGPAACLRQLRRPLDESGRVRHRRRDAVRAFVGADEAHARLAPPERGDDAFALGVLRPGDRRRAGVRASAGVARNRSVSPSVATVSVANPVVGILIGTLLFDERLSRPAWHVVIAVIGLCSRSSARSRSRSRVKLQRKMKAAAGS